MRKVTAEEVQAAATEAHIHYVEVRECSMCRAPIGYVISDHGAIGFDSNCDCTKFTSAIQLHTWQDAADHINNLIYYPEYHERALKDFGFETNGEQDET